MNIYSIKDKDQYEAFGLDKKKFIPGDFLQSYQWGEFQKKTGDQIFRIIIKNDQKKSICRATLIERKPAPAVKYAFIPYGPAIKYSKSGKEKLREIFALIKKFSRQKGNCFVRFNPPVPISKANLKKFFDSEFYLSKAKTKEPQETLYLDLSQNLDKILSQMKSKTRYNIRLAQRKEVRVQKGYDKKMIKDFLTLLNITSKRNKFSLHQNNYYKKMIQTLAANKMLKIFTAYYNNQPIASNIIIFYNNCATYLHGASSNEHRNLMATYLLQWEAIQEAKNLNCLFYDFWGIDKIKWPGVTRFKLGFGGEIIKYLPTYEIPVLNFKFQLFNLVKKIIQK
ncbi:MAG: peptidoglycan bridge formation glycyltransferase FemA/FemB family protein [Candidatus Moranbacteria bacterium]|nr:peptidoglycan bridge formation glycyltransferase FemA/FemB family protein [Candidatus Moranbacteria bacterium]